MNTKEELAALKASVGYIKIDTLFQHHVNTYKWAAETLRFVVNDPHLFDTQSLVSGEK